MKPANTNDLRGQAPARGQPGRISPPAPGPASAARDTYTAPRQRPDTGPLRSPRSPWDALPLPLKHKILEDVPEREKAFLICLDKELHSLSQQIDALGALPRHGCFIYEAVDIIIRRLRPFLVDWQHQNAAAYQQLVLEITPQIHRLAVDWSETYHALQAHGILAADVKYSLLVQRLIELTGMFPNQA